jgi:hypothetical protein
MFKRLIQILVGAAALFVLITWWALETDGVAIIETEMQSGSARETHIWFVESGDELWIEAGTPGNAWYHDIQERPTVAFLAPDADETIAYHAIPIQSAEAHDQVRSRLRAKYGLRDWWISQIFDTTGSIAVRLEPAAGRGDRDDSD